MSTFQPPHTSVNGCPSQRQINTHGLADFADHRQFPKESTAGLGAQVLEVGFLPLLYQKPALPH
jgi:hypothetical protein